MLFSVDPLYIFLDLEVVVLDKTTMFNVYCMEYGAMKSSKNGNFVLRKLSASSRQKQKIV